jgi:hypothetical protein
VTARTLALRITREKALLATLVWFAVAAVPTAHAASGPSPDPAPHAAPAAGGGGNPSPDPAPQPAPASSPVSAAPAQPAAPVQSAAPVVPRPSSSGIAVAAPASSHSSTPTTATAAIKPSVPARRSKRHVVHYGRRPAAWVATAARQVRTPWHADPLLAGAAASSQPTPAQRNGLLLLLGSAALAVLAVASASMLRLLRRMDGVRTS